jgi:hypothetical protein
MAPDDEDEEDLYDDEFDFVDDDDDDDESDVEDEEDDDSELDSAKDRSADIADSELDNEPAPRPVPRPAAARRSARDEQADATDDVDPDDRLDAEIPEDEEPVDEFAPPPPAANYRVHIYEYQEFKRTIDRPFTAEDAEAFASEYNRTSKSYGRFAVAGKDDAKPRKVLD